MTRFAWVVWLGALLGATHVMADLRGARAVAGVTKAAPIALLLLWVASHSPVVGEAYRWLVAAGLVFSMGGDLFLLSDAGFRAGLASFFAGHVCYGVAFVAASAFVPSWAALLPLAAAGGVMGAVLWRHAPSERAPVAAYVAVISGMSWAAIGRALTPPTPEPSGTLAAVGAVTFMISDSVLAVGRFVRPWRTAHAAVMATYYAAQALIAASVAR